MRCSLVEAAAVSEWFVTASPAFAVACGRGHVHVSCTSVDLKEGAVQSLDFASEWLKCSHPLLCRLWEVSAGMQTDVSNAAFECSSLTHWYSADSTGQSIALSVAFNNFSVCSAGFWQKQCLLIGFFSNFLLSAAFPTFLFFSFSTFQLKIPRMHSIW